MRRAIMPEPKKIVFQDVRVPEISDDEVLVRIRRIGICGSDIHVYHGKHPFTVYPVVQGHEVSGEIAKIGKNVNGFEKGDVVTIIPQIVCGKCYSCLHGQYHICDNLKVFGFMTMGVASDYFAVKADLVLKAGNIKDFDDVAMVEPVAVAVHALKRLCSVEGKKVLILGAGPIGNLVGQTAKALGADKVMITDVSDFRLGKAKTCGIDFCVNSKTEDVSQAIVKHFGPDKADCILDCAGVKATIGTAISNARKGTDIVVVAVFADKASVDLGLLQDRELRLIGTLMYKKGDFDTAIDLVGSGKINTKALITDRFVFEDYLKAYEYIDHKKDLVMKVIVSLD